MVNYLSNEKELYESIKSEGIILNKSVWDSIYRCVNDNTAAIILICQYCLKNNESMPELEAKKILSYAKEIKYAINPITITPKESLKFVKSEDNISLNLTIQQLIKHQFGNDIYAIELMLRNAIDPITVLSIPLEITHKILSRAQTIKEYIEKFKEVVQQREEERYHSLYDSFKDGLILTDMKGNLLDINQAFVAMLGYTEKEIKQLVHQQLTPIKWHKREENIIKRLITSQRYSDEYEKEYIKKNGTVFPVSLKVWLIKNKQGEPLGVWGIVRDITERKMAEKEILANLLDSHMVIDKISDGITVSDAQGYFEVFNLRMQEIAGYTIDEANQAEDFNILIYPKIEDRQEVFKELSKIVTEKGYHEIETAIHAKDGSEKTLLVSTSSILYKNRNMFLSIWRDITERKKSEEGMHLLAAIVESSGVAIIGNDLNNTITSWNRGAEHLYGYTEKEALGKSISIIVPKERADEPHAFLEKIKNGQQIEHFETLRQKKDKTKFPISLTFSPIKNADGGIVGASTIGRDITERKGLEDKLKNLASHDELTGCFNFRSTMELLEKEIARALRYQTQFSVGMIDIDDFKSKNDEYGHQAGNDVLVAFTTVIKNSLRSIDSVGRYGGEEFIVILPETDAEQALVVMERIRNNLAQTKITSSYLDNAKEITLKFSAGIAAFPHNAKDLKGLIWVADNALLQAKKEGKNRTVLERRKLIRFSPKPGTRIEVADSSGKKNVVIPQIVDISKEGILFLSTQDIINEEFLCRIYRPKDEFPFELTCKVKHKEKSENKPYRMGVYFPDIPEADKEKLSQCIESPS